MRKQWMLPAILFCMVAGSAVANESSGTADVRSSVRGMDFDGYIRLRKGMTEGELLERAGPPDHQTNDGSVGHKEVVRRGEPDSVSVSSTELIVKTFYYFPTAANPFTTVVTTTGGRIVDPQRERKF